jgi:hypothetical protein
MTKKIIGQEAVVSGEKAKKSGYMTRRSLRIKIGLKGKRKGR